MEPAGGRQVDTHTSIAFRHLLPNSARSGYATEGALFISAQQSADVVSALLKVRVLIYDCRSNLAPKVNMRSIHPGLKKKKKKKEERKSSVSIQTIVVLFALV